MFVDLIIVLETQTLIHILKKKKIKASLEAYYEWFRMEYCEISVGSPSVFRHQTVWFLNRVGLK